MPSMVAVPRRLSCGYHLASVMPPNFRVPKRRFGRTSKKMTCASCLIIFIFRPRRTYVRQTFTILPLPNEDFARRNKRGNPDFEGRTFQGREYSIWLRTIEKCFLRNPDFIFLFLLPKSSFGEHTFRKRPLDGLCSRSVSVLRHSSGSVVACSKWSMIT